jgi:guanylate kinase
MTLEKIVRAKVKKKHDTKSIILCGKSGSGKDFLLETFNLKQVCTHTTRPKRDYEINGVHKWFHKEEDLLSHGAFFPVFPEGTVATTQRGNFIYWTELSDFKNPADIWIIDVPGILSIAEEHKHRFKVVYLDAPLWRRIINMRLRKEPWLSILKRVWIDHKDFKALKKIPHIRITR